MTTKNPPGSESVSEPITLLSLSNRIAELEQQLARERERAEKAEARAEAWRAAAEYGDCPPLCSARHGCDSERCYIEIQKDKARALEGATDE